MLSQRKKLVLPNSANQALPVGRAQPKAPKLALKSTWHLCKKNDTSNPGAWDSPSPSLPDRPICLFLVGWRTAHDQPFNGTVNEEKKKKGKKLGHLGWELPSEHRVPHAYRVQPITGQLLVDTVY